MHEKFINFYDNYGKIYIKLLCKIILLKNSNYYFII